MMVVMRGWEGRKSGEDEEERKRRVEEGNSEKGSKASEARDERGRAAEGEPEVSLAAG